MDVAVDVGLDVKDVGVDVVGLGADGWDGLSPHSRGVLTRAAVVIGGARQLALLPEQPGQRRLHLPTPLRAGLLDLLDSSDSPAGPVAVLASGDPLLSGIGGTLVELLGAARVRIHPAVSSVSLAAAEMRWPLAGVDVVSLVGRDLATLRRVLSPGRRVLALSADERTPAAVAALLTEAGFGPSRLTVLGDLGSPQQSRIDLIASDFRGPVSRLNILAIDCVAVPGTPPRPLVGGLPDDAFDHDGQLTKRDARASALARLAPAPGQLLWDVGAGAGSVAIEWSRVDPRCRAVAIERDPARAARIGGNAAALGVPGLVVVTGAAPAALADLPAPDAVFVGGGATVPGLLDSCWAVLGSGGRLVVHGVTLETERLLVDWHARVGGELIRLSVERVEPLGSFRGWAPARPIVQWAVTKESTG